MRDMIIKKGVLTSYTGKDRNIVIPEGVTKIEDEAFQWCFLLESVIIPSTVTSIGYIAFSGCTGLKSIVIPESVDFIDESAFYECYDLVIYAEAKSKPEYWSSKINKKSCLFGETTVRWGVKCGSNDEYLYMIKKSNSVNIIRYLGEDGAVEVPSQIDGYDVTGIIDNAFAGLDFLESVTIPECVTIIDEDIFYGSEDVKIYATKGSCAEKFALENDMDYELI